MSSVKRLTFSLATLFSLAAAIPRPQWQDPASSSATATSSAAGPDATPFKDNTSPSGNTSPQGGNSSTSLIPNGKKAGSAGGRAVPHWQDHLGWWYDWSPQPEQRGSLESVAMLWGVGENGDIDAQRFAQFKELTEAPKYLLGMNEPDCPGSMSAGVDVSKAVQVWNEHIAPWGDKGSMLGSPSMCMQDAEKWLGEFAAAGLARDWDFTAVHVYKPDMEGVKKVIDHYWDAYGKPIWVTEFACVYDQEGFRACDDQGEIDSWIDGFVELMEGDDRIHAYGYTDGGGLNDMWLPTGEDGSQLTESGQRYLDAISKYH